MRHLSTNQINNLISLKGIFIRCSEIIPEPKEIYFRCSTPGCEQSDLRALERGRVVEPSKCTRCGFGRCFEVIYNLSSYADKQYIKFQERPDEVPEGETPININLVVYDDLVDECKPGDSIQIIGIYRAEPTRVQKNRTNVHSVFKAYIDVVSIVYENKNKIVLNNELRQDRDKVEYTEGEIEQFLALARDPGIYDKLIRSFAPSLFGLKKTKFGLLCQLFGGTGKSFDTLQRGRFRSEINTLLIGDPSTAKSQLLCFVNKIAPRGIYTSGKGSSAVGLTAYVTTDPETKEIVLESGALVLSDHGICCIDEFDKMDEGTQSILHEAMEQQTISIAKKGIVCSLNARTSILAAANPKESRYNPSKSIVYNLNLSPSLLSRFDLIYLMLDQAREEEDRELSLHIIGLFSNTHLKESKKDHSVISQEFLTKYISYSRENVHPQISEEAERELVRGYLQMRQLGTS